VSAQRTPERLRVLVCLLYYLPHRSGLTLYVQRLAERLAARGHRVTVLCSRHDRSCPAEAVENGVRVVRLPTLPLAISRGFLLPTYPWSLLREMRAHDVASVHTPMLETPLLRLASALTGTPLVVTHHADLVLPAGLGNRIVTRLMLAFHHFMARAAARFVHHTRDYAQSSLWIGPYLDKLEVIPPLVDVPLPDPERVRELRRQWAPAGGPIVGYAGRFVEEKRPELLLRALDVVAAEHPHARLVFAGQHDVPYERYSRRHRELVARLGERLRLLGVIAEPQQMADFYAACDVLAMASDRECLGLVQVEAMLCGTPVVMTDVRGGRMPVKQTGMGRLAPPGDWRGIGAAILEVLRDRGRFLRPRQEIARRYDLDAAIDAYEEVFRQACGAPARAAVAASAPVR
jgi:glycosyltransferase involved in cell wall biosynthesis